MQNNHTSKLMSIPLTELVILPIEMMSTPVLPYLVMFFELIPPDASSRTLLRNFLFLRI